MAISIGKMLGDIERDLVGFARDPLSIFNGAKLSQKDQRRVDGLRNSLRPPGANSSTRVAPRPEVTTTAATVPTAGGPITININISIHPDGIVAGVGTQPAAAQPGAVVVAPPPDMRSKPAMPATGAGGGMFGSLSGANAMNLNTPTRTTSKPAKSGRPGR